MGVFDIVIILLGIGGLYLGYKYGAFKIISEFITILIGTVVASFINGYICSFLYKFLPFLNLFGNYRGLKSLNILIYKVFIFIGIILIVRAIINAIL